MVTKSWHLFEGRYNFLIYNYVVTIFHFEKRHLGNDYPVLVSKIFWHYQFQEKLFPASQLHESVVCIFQKNSLCLFKKESLLKQIFQFFFFSSDKSSQKVAELISKDILLLYQEILV